MMRSIFAAGATMLVGLLGTAPQAQAGPTITIGWHQTYVSGHASCGCPVYSKRVCSGHDRYHRPVYTTHRQEFRCGCSKNKTHDKTLEKYYERLEEDYRELEQAERKYRERMRGDHRDRQKAYEKYEAERLKHEKEARKHRDKIEKHNRKYHDSHRR